MEHINLIISKRIITNNNLREKEMVRLTLVLWAVAATTLAGIFILIVLTVPSLAAKDAELMIPAVVLGCIIAAPISYLIAKKIMTLSK